MVAHYTLTLLHFLRLHETLCLFCFYLSNSVTMEIHIFVKNKKKCFFISRVSSKNSFFSSSSKTGIQNLSHLIDDVITTLCCRVEHTTVHTSYTMSTLIGQRIKTQTRTTTQKKENPSLHQKLQTLLLVKYDSMTLSHHKLYFKSIHPL